MKALVYTAPYTLQFRDEPDPVPGNDEVLVKVDAVGICGSDMHGYHGFDERRPAPLILGHEAAGRIASGPRAGKRVTVNPLVTCLRCEFCLDGRPHLCRERQILSLPARPGAFAELVKVPEANAIEIPDGLDMTRAALVEPLAVGYHAAKLGLKTQARPASAITTAVLGGGAIGIASALCLQLMGVARIAVGEPHTGRRATVTKAGPFRAYAPGEVGQPADGSVDLVLDAVGAEATRAAACRLVKPGGTIVHIGLLPGSAGVDVRRITLQEVTFVGTYCYTPLDFVETLAAVADGRLGALDWLEERPLSAGAQAFRDLDEGRLSVAKVVLRP